MKLAFYIAKYGDKLDKTISFFTRGEFSHVELVFSDGVSFSSSYRDNGVRFKTIDFGERWNIIDINKFLHQKEETIRSWCEGQVGCKYDILGAIFQKTFYQDRWYCSEICSTVLFYYGNRYIVKTTIPPIKLYNLVNK